MIVTVFSICIALAVCILFTRSVHKSFIQKVFFVFIFALFIGIVTNAYIGLLYCLSGLLAGLICFTLSSYVVPTTKISRILNDQIFPALIIAGIFMMIFYVLCSKLRLFDVPVSPVISTGKEFAKALFGGYGLVVGLTGVSIMILLVGCSLCITGEKEEE